MRIIYFCKSEITTLIVKFCCISYLVSLETKCFFASLYQSRLLFRAYLHLDFYIMKKRYRHTLDKTFVWLGRDNMSQQNTKQKIRKEFL